MKTVADIVRDINNKNYSPVYFFSGDEPYYIDKLSDYIEDKVLEKDERDLNLTILYGKEVNAEFILTRVKSFPMMSNYQLVFLKNAQDLSEKDFDKLLPYFEKPVQSTIFVVCFHKTLGKRMENKLLKVKSGVEFYVSKKVESSKIPQWIQNYLAKKKFTCDDTTARIIADYLGEDLEKIDNELSKLMINLKPEQHVTMDDVEQNIGISKKYNIFELQNAIFARNTSKAVEIAHSFASNPKENSIFLVIQVLFSSFQKVFLCHQAQDKNIYSLASLLPCAPKAASVYLNASTKYSIPALLNVFSIFQEYDLKMKGVNNVATEPELIKELVYKIVTVV